MVSTHISLLRYNDTTSCPSSVRPTSGARSKPIMRVNRHRVRSSCATEALIQRVMVTVKATAKSTNDTGNTILAMKSSLLLASFPPSDKSPWCDYKLTDIM